MDAKLIEKWQKIGNLYELLGLQEKAPAEKINKGYRKEAFKHHPDKTKDPKSKAIFEKLGKAKEILSDPIERAQYDKWLETKLYQKTKIKEMNFERSKHMHNLNEREKKATEKHETEQKKSFDKEQRKRQEAVRIQREMEDEALRKKEEEIRLKDLDKKSKVFNAIKVKWKNQPNAEYNEDLLKIIFGKYGEIRSVKIEPGSKKGVIEFVHRLSAEKAHEENKQEDKEKLGISDSLKVKLLYKEKQGSKKLKTEANSKRDDFSLSSNNLSKISNLMNRDSNTFFSNKEDEIRRANARTKYLESLLAKEMA
jgi:curved DNA-binding protein CbpA